ncbi:MAG: hypothetical protein QME68_07920, partial [Elusimicrobiota bacterium]|nr:hypothetical protein [Elusimicrobiota bacterium]
MEKRVILATILSTIVILLWWLWFTPQPQKKLPVTKPPQEITQKAMPEATPTLSVDTPAGTQKFESKDYTLETPFAIVTFNTSGAKIKNYRLKEGRRKENLTDLILHSIDNSFEPQNFATLPEINFKCISIASESITFSAQIDKIKFQKKYELNETRMHLLEFKLENTSKDRRQFEYELTLGPGVGCEQSKRKDEIRLTKVVTLSRINKSIKKLKEGTYNISDCKWLVLKNRYYFSAVMLSSPFHAGIGDVRRDMVQPVLTDAYVTKVGTEKLLIVKLPIKTELQPYQKTELSF